MYLSLISVLSSLQRLRVHSWKSLYALLAAFHDVKSPAVYNGFQWQLTSAYIFILLSQYPMSHVDWRQRSTVHALDGDFMSWNIRRRKSQHHINYFNKKGKYNPTRFSCSQSICQKFRVLDLHNILGYILTFYHHLTQRISISWGVLNLFIQNKTRGKH